jgi:hypothetical protein
MKAFVRFLVLVTSSIVLSSCHRADEAKQSLTIGFDEDYKIKSYYDGSGWSAMSRWMNSFTDSEGLTKLTFYAGNSYSMMSTQHCAIYIAGTSKPLDPNGDNFAWDLHVSSKVPLELVFSGFQNTNGYKTNGDGTVFDCTVGETNIVFMGQLISVFEKETNRWHK